MAAHKPKRGAPAIDMTAMVDVAFLLLTFFILTTTKFREDTKAEIDLPSSGSKIDVPVNGLMTFSVTDSGRVFIGFTDIPTREEALQKAMADEGFEVSETGFKYFSSLETFGVPVSEMGTWLTLPDEQMQQYPHKGIPAKVDSVNTRNDVMAWIRWGRLTDQKMSFAIKGDLDTKYPEIEDVMNSLQDWKINSFSLITKLEDGSEEEEAEE